MYKGKKIFAFIPARGGSKRIPGKNMKQLNGEPLIWYTIKAVRESKYIDYYIVSTDDVSTWCYCSSLFFPIPTYNRSLKQCEDSYSTDDLRNDMYEQFKGFDYCITLHPTSPFRTAEDIDKGIEMIIDQDADSLLSVREITRDYWQSLYTLDGQVYYHRYRFRFLQSQDFHRKIYANAHFLTIWKWGKNSGKEIPYIIEYPKTIDIDTPEDFEYAEFVMKKMEIDKILDGEVERHGR